MKSIFTLFNTAWLTVAGFLAISMIAEMPTNLGKLALMTAAILVFTAALYVYDRDVFR